MPVVSPHRSSASALAGSYRPTFSTSALDRPYFSSSSYSPRITTYSERYSSRTYTDSDGRRVYSRSGSITEDGVTTRFREESRENSVRRDSLSRDSGISSIRENSISDYPRRDSSVSRDSSGSTRLSAMNVLDSVAELRNKYSPANYVPACLRKNDNISRSKSINDIGLPPIESKISKKKVNDVGGLYNCNNSIGVLNSNTTNDNMTVVEDDNGNRASVADLRKKFDEKLSKPSKPPPIEIEGASIKISDNLFKKQDNVENAAAVATTNGTSAKGNSRASTKAAAKKASSKALNGDGAETRLSNRLSKNAETNSSATATTTADCQNVAGSDEGTKLEVNDATVAKNGNSVRGISEDGEENGVLNGRSASRVNNFASYISSKDYQKSDTLVNGEEIVNGEANDTEAAAPITNKRFTDISSSPKLNNSTTSSRSTLSPSASSILNSNSISSAESRSRRSSDRDGSRTYGNEENSIVGGGSSIYDKYGTGNQVISTTTASSGIKTLGLNGLKNIGNTCFMNSVIQCLSNTKLLLEYLLKDLHVADMNTTISGMKGALIKAFVEVIKELWSEDSSDRVVNTTSLKSQIQRFAPRFMGYAQQDAQEFLRYLLEGLHEDVNRVTEKPKPILTEIDEKLSDSQKAAESWSRYLRMDNSRIVDCFVGQLKSTLKCTHCGHCSVTFDPFWDLSLPIPQRVGQVRLSQCLDSFTREETLDGDEKPTCSKCKERRKCTKSFTIQKFPKILVIHLKRFSLAERFRGKLSVTVDFPLEGLDMSHYAADNVASCRYSLYAVSNHSGTTYSGHYTAYCRHPYAKTWHEYNDSRVSPISSKSIVSGEAYVLFYEQEGQRSHL